MTVPAPAAEQAGTIPLTLDALAAALIALYAGAEQDLLDSMATAASRGITDATATARTVMFAEMRRAAERVATRVRLHAPPLVATIVDEAARRGDSGAVQALRQAVGGDRRLAALYLARFDGTSGHAIAAANAIAFELANKLDTLGNGMLRFADDAYRAAVADAAGRLVLGRERLTPATAQHLAWRQLTRQGITGYTDARGRRWNLASYVEVATRTAVQRAYNTAHHDRMTAVGIRYFTVTRTGHPCPLCIPWEGRILSDGPVGLIRDTSARDGRPVAFRVKATVTEAVAAGLQHPNCRHVLLPYLPGVTSLSPTSTLNPAGERAYRAVQRLRALEREVRAGKREQAAALDDLSRARAGHRVRTAQARIRTHVDQNGLVRRRRREQLDLGNH